MASPLPKLELAWLIGQLLDKYGVSPNPHVKQVSRSLILIPKSGSDVRNRLRKIWNSFKTKKSFKQQNIAKKWDCFDTHNQISSAKIEMFWLYSIGCVYLAELFHNFFLIIILLSKYHFLWKNRLDNKTFKKIRIRISPTAGRTNYRSTPLNIAQQLKFSLNHFQLLSKCHRWIDQVRKP